MHATALSGGFDTYESRLNQTKNTRVRDPVLVGSFSVRPRSFGQHPTVFATTYNGQRLTFPLCVAPKAKRAARSRKPPPLQNAQRELPAVDRCYQTIPVHAVFCIDSDCPSGSRLPAYRLGGKALPSLRSNFETTNRERQTTPS